MKSRHEMGIKRFIKGHVRIVEVEPKPCNAKDDIGVKNVMRGEEGKCHKGIVKVNHTDAWNGCVG